MLKRSPEGSEPETPVFARPWERVAWGLREQPQPLDDVARARMERNLVDAWRSRGARAVALPSNKPLFSRSILILSVVASAAFGALGALVLPSDRYELSASSEVPARFDLVIDDGSVQSGNLTEGQVLESGPHGRIEVAMEQSRVDITPDSRVRFERLGRSELRLSLMMGRIEVAFHPEHAGQQHMSIETRSARVLVVGTQFSVDVDGQGNTKVTVTEGVVQVVPRGQGETRFVRAHESIDVPIQSQERAVREGIEHRLRAESHPAEHAEHAEHEAADALGAEGAAGGGDADAVFRSSSGVDMEFELEAVGDRASRRAVQERTGRGRLESARELLLQGKHAAARERLYKLAKSETQATGTRVEALVLIAESFTAQGQIPKAAETYRDAVNLAPRHPAGFNALFALARLQERYADDRSAAGAVYREYLERAPRGALGAQAREALCRLGDSKSCDAGR